MSARTRKPKRGRGITAAVISVLIIGALLVGGDVLARQYAESRLAEELQANLPGVSDDVSVQIGGFAFLPQLISGRIEQAEVTASSVQVDMFQGHDARAVLTGVGVEEPYNAETIEVQATAPVETLRAAAAQAGLPDGVDVQVDRGLLVATGTVLGTDLAWGLVPSAQHRAISLNTRWVQIGGLEVELSDVPGPIENLFSDIEIPLQDLPEDLALDDLQVRDGGVWLLVIGENVPLGDLATSG